MTNQEEMKTDESKGNKQLGTIDLTESDREEEVTFVKKEKNDTSPMHTEETEDKQEDRMEGDEEAQPQNEQDEDKKEHKEKEDDRK